MGTGRYIGGSIINTIGLAIAIIGIIMIIGNFIHYDLWFLLGAIVLVIIGLILSVVGRSYKYGSENDFNS